MDIFGAVSIQVIACDWGRKVAYMESLNSDKVL